MAGAPPSPYEALVSTLGDRLHRLLHPREMVHERGPFMDREAAAQVEAGIGYLERGTAERDQVEEDVKALEARCTHLEDIVEQAMRELDHYADNPTDPEAIDKVSDLVEVLRDADCSRYSPRTTAEAEA